MSENRNADNQSATDESIDSVNRRRFVKSLGIAGGATVGLSGVGAAKENPEVATSAEDITHKYDAEDIRKILANHKDLLDTLDNKNLIESNTIDALSIDSLSPPSSNNSNEPGGERVVKKQIKEEEDIEVQIIRQIERGALSIFADVEADLAYATLNPHGDDPVIDILPNTDEISTQTTKNVCQSICNTNNDCCRCIKKCIAYCNGGLTPNITYVCGCCKYIPLKCIDNC